MIGWGHALSLLHSKYDYDYLKRQPIKVITQLLISARKNENENKAWSMWLIEYLASSLAGNKIPDFNTCLANAEAKSEPINEVEYEDILKKAEKAKQKHLNEKR